MADFVTLLGGFIITLITDIVSSAAVFEDSCVFIHKQNI